MMYPTSSRMSAGRQAGALRGGAGAAPSLGDLGVAQTAGTPQTPNMTSILATYAPGVENSSLLDNWMGRYVTTGGNDPRFGAKPGGSLDLRGGSQRGFF